MVPQTPSEKEKSIIDWLRYVVAFAFLLPCFLVLVVFVKYEGAWRMWLSLLLSRGIYIILATLIFGCFIITFFKNKVQGNGRGDGKVEESWCSPQELWKTSYIPTCADLTTLSRKSFGTDDVCDSDVVKQMLREADTRNEALKRELEELNKTRIALEERSGALEREKAKAEEKLEETKYQSAIESENLRKEAAITQRQLQQVLEEKEMLSREISSVTRESRITESALKDQARLTTRLEEARAELNRLKQQMEEMKVERDTAVAIAADLAVRAQGAADDSAQLIGQWVRREMENRKKSDNSSGAALERSEHGSSEVFETNEVENENKTNENIELFQESTEITFEVQQNNIFLNNSVPTEMNHHTTHLDMNPDEGSVINWENEESGGCLQTIGCGPVTSSAAFRDFLTAHYN